VGATSSSHPSSLVVIGSMDSRKVVAGVMGSSSKLDSSEQVRAREISCAKDFESTRTVPKGTQGVTRGTSGGLGLSVECLGLSEEEESKRCLEVCEAATEMMGKELSTTLSGLGRTGDTELGPRTEPKLLQVYQRKDAKPKQKRISSSGEGSGSIHEGLREDRAIGMIREGILQEITLIESPAAPRFGFMGLESVGGLGKATSLVSASGGPMRHRHLCLRLCREKGRRKK
jgi:hypothetical protein